MTLIELVIVLLIVGILTAVAAPKYQAALAHYRVNAAAGRVAADLRMVGAYARQASLAQTVKFNLAADSYAATSMPDLNDPNATYAVALRSSEYVADIVSASFSGSAVVKFNIYGRPHATGSVVVASGPLQRTIQVDEAGNVRIL